jgi:hypothetical protein
VSGFTSGPLQGPRYRPAQNPCGKPSSSCFWLFSEKLRKKKIETWFSTK